MEQSKNAKMVQILRRIKPEMHGAVVESMERRGIRYGLNYGVAVPVIRKAVQEYAPDHELAEYLYLQDVRELKLAAVYTDNPACVDKEQMERWAGQMPADEIMEHAAMHLFYDSPDASEIISTWLQYDDSRKIKGALYMAGQRALMKLDASETIKGYLCHIRKLLERVVLPERAAIYFFCQGANVSDELYGQIKELAAWMMCNDKVEIRELGDEVEAFITVSE